MPSSPGAVQEPSTRVYLPQLDGVRAVAVALVVIHHAVTPLRFGGYVGVDVFFVLSGYLITGILLADQERSGRVNLRRFYVRRAIRLYPALLTTVILLLPLALLLSRHKLAIVIDAGGALSYLTPLMLLVNDGSSVIFRHTWSLGVEEMFYLVWPLILIALLRLRRWRTATVWIGAGLGILILAAGAASALTGSDFPYLSRSGGLFLGCAARALLYQRVVRFPPVVGWAGVACLCVAVVSGTRSPQETLTVLLAIAGSLALVIYLSHPRSGRLVAILAAAPLAYVGRISYEIYLWHYPVFMLASRLTGRTFLALSWWCAPLSLLLAALTHALLIPLSNRWKARTTASRPDPARVAASTAS